MPGSRVKVPCSRKGGRGSREHGAPIEALEVEAAKRRRAKPQGRETTAAAIHPPLALVEACCAHA